ncbi:SDR family NAD(P)-dependent oxidoreductase [Halorussus sp. MSC15.2]|uniref:SDR family NAD(P)-dependent oxidoreductase n=1 Tax=Halorussus sp. MSC15.2 TaxID=2283638 RepID=UPI0013D61200|nr:SDR family NAD(P)-dependent oxidoreductase [Halorussus sp. MSC15.2]NEU59109.1 SDR family oxidoreductase [Halorussus sp. MSC15.2]
MQCDLSGRTALVTGSGRGNGRATALTLAENGADVVVNDIDPDRAEDTASEVRERGSDALAVPADITDEAEVEAMFERTAEEVGAVDVLVNNAGVGDAQRFTEETDDEIWELNLQTHLWGSIYCCRHAIPGMREQGYGKIVNVSSIHTKEGIGMSPQYDVGKYSLLGLTKSLAGELAYDGIRVNAVAPGWVNTRMTEHMVEKTREKILDLNPLDRFAEPEEIADAVLFLSSPASDYVNGHELRVDGGQKPIESWKHEEY